MKRTFFIFRWYKAGKKQLCAIECRLREEAVRRFKREHGEVEFEVEKDYL